MIVAVIILGVLVLTLLAVLLLQRKTPADDAKSALLLKADMAELNKSMGALKDGLQKQLQDQANISAKQIQTQSAASIKILEQVTEKLTKLEGTNKNVGDIASELK